MTSCNNREHSSSSSLTSVTSSELCRHSLDSIRQSDATTASATWTDLVSYRQRSRNQINHTTNRSHKLQVNADIDIASSQAVTPHAIRESLAEEELLERLKEVIHEFMARPDRQYSYNATMRWTVHHGNEFCYNIVILMNRPDDFI